MKYSKCAALRRVPTTLALQSLKRASGCVLKKSRTSADLLTVSAGALLNKVPANLL